MKNALLKVSKFLNGKGFYVVMACCAMVVAIAGYVAYTKTTKIISEELKMSEENFNKDYSNVNNTLSDILKEEETETEAEENEDTSTDTEIISVEAPVEKPFAMPISGEILNAFSNGELVKSKTLGTWKTHDGIDVKADAGTPVYAISSGTVKEVKEDGLWGVCIIIDHENGIEGHYYGLSAGVLVKSGDAVDIGQTIGTVGNTAQCEIAEESHLHFGVKKNSEWVDPQSVMSKP